MTILQSALAVGPALLALSFGLVLGVFCFGGLWWTVTLLGIARAVVVHYLRVAR